MADIRQWLGALGLERYADAFEANEIDVADIPHLTNDDFREIGVALGPRRRIQAAVQEEAGHGGSAPPPDVVTEAVPPPPENNPEAAAGEREAVSRRHVTVVFADLVGSTALAQRLDPEDYSSALASYHAAARSAVTDGDGHVAQLLGDGVLAYFGHPRAHEDDGVRALKAALRIVTETSQLMTLPGVTLEARVGIATGMVVTSTAADGGIALGSTPNLAARLQSLAEPGGVVVADGTRHLVGSRFQLESLGYVDLKGFDQPQRAFRVVAEREAVDIGDTPLIGRSVEFDRVLTAVKSARDTRRGQAVWVAGEAGIGKSRLISAVRDRLAVEGCGGVAVAIPDFGPDRRRATMAGLARELLFALCPTDDCLEEALAQAIASGLVVENQRVHFHALLDQPMDPDLERLLDAMPAERRMAGELAAVSALISEAARLHPTLVVVEDVHLADGRLLDDITALVDLAHDLPLCLILTGRQPPTAAVPAWLASHRTPHVAVSLGPLDAADVAAIADTRPDLDPAVIQSCIDRAAGHPLFLMHLLEYAADRHADAVPGTIQGLVQARMDALDAADRRAVQAASVLGVEVDIGAVEHLIERQGYDPTRLAGQSLIIEEAGRLRFTHALIRDAVYDTLLRDQRRRHHVRAAEWFGEARPDLKAHHLDRADDPSAAAAYLAASHFASARYRQMEALDLIARGLEIAEVPETRFELNMRNGNVRRTIGNNETALAAYRLAEQNASTDLARARSWVGQAQVLRVTDRGEEGLDLLARAEPLAAGVDRLMSEIHALRSSFLFLRGDNEACAAESQLAHDYAVKSGNPALIATALGGLADAHNSAGRIFTAHRLYVETCRIAQAEGLGRIEAGIRALFGNLLFSMLMIDECLKDSLEVVDFALKVGQPRAEVVARINAARAYGDMLEPAAAAEQLDAAQRVAEALDARRFIALCHIERSIMMLSNGDRETADREIGAAWERCQEGGAEGFIGATICGLRAEIETDRDRRYAFLDQGAALLARGTVAFGHLFYRSSAIMTALDVGDWQRARAEADLLERFFAEEPTERIAFLASRARALADVGEGVATDRTLEQLEALASTARASRALFLLRPVEAALARLRDPMAAVAE